MFGNVVVLLITYPVMCMASVIESLVSHSCNDNNNTSASSSAVAHDIRTSSGGEYYTLGSNLSPLHSTYDDKGKHITIYAILAPCTE